MINTLALMFGMILLLSIPHHLRRIQRRFKIARWEKQLNLNVRETQFNQLYDSINGFQCSKAAREGQDAPEYVYGEINFKPFIALMSLCHPGPKTVFMDLGSGTGKAVIAMALVFEIQSAEGVEIFEALHQVAEKQQNIIKQMNPPPATSNIQFIRDSLLQINLHHTTLIFIHSTAFFGEHWRLISQHLEQCSKGTRVVSTSKAVNSSAFTIEKTCWVEMSFGVVQAFIQRKQA